MVLRRRYPQAYRPVRSGDCGHKQSILANLPNYKDVTNANGGSVYLGILLGTLFAFVPAEASAVFQTISSIYMEATERSAVAAISAVSYFNWL